MNLLFIHQAFMTHGDAGGTRHFELAKYLVGRGHKVTVISSDVSYLSGEKLAHNSSNETVDSIEIIRVAMPVSLHAGFIGRLINYVLFMLKSLLAALKVKDVDLVLGTSPPIFQSLTALVVATIRRVPFIFEVRDLWPDFMVEIGAIKSPFFIYPARLLERILYRKAALIVINSPGFMPHLRSKDVEGEKIRIIANGVDTSMFDPDEKGEDFRKEWGLDNRFAVLYAGALGKSNDIGTLLGAASLLKGTDIIFVLVGGGNQLESIKNTARNLDLSNVILVPPQSKERIPEIICAADLTIAILKDVPMFKTTYPNKVFDYMAGGRAVILAIDGVIRDVVESAEAGLFVEPGSPKAIAAGIEKLYRNEDLRRKMGKNGSEYVKKHFERSKQAEAFEAILEEVLRDWGRKTKR